MKYEMISGKEFNELIKKEFDIENISNIRLKIKFTDEVAPADATVFDVSVNKNQSVVAWIDDEFVFVSTQQKGQKIIANEDCSWMFYDCKSLKELDLSSFDTSSVTDMRGMFNGCKNLKEIDVSGWDTSNVKNMSFMFGDLFQHSLLRYSFRVV